MASPRKKQSRERSLPLRNRPFLEQTAGTGWGRTFELSRRQISIGRTKDNEIVLDSSSISRIHARVKKSARGWIIEDNESKNGIYVNGAQVVSVVLQGGDVVQIGEFVFRFADPKLSLHVQRDRKPENSSPNADPSMPTRSWQARTNPPVAAEVEEDEIKGARPPGEQTEVLSPIPPPARRRAPPTQAGPVVRDVILLAQLRNALDRAYLIGGLAVGVGVGFLIYFTASKPPRKVVERVVETRNLESPLVPTALPNPPMRSEASEVPEPPKDDSFAKSRATPEAKPVDIARTTPAAPKAQPSNLPKEVEVYLNDGRYYLGEGDFESAALSFRFALAVRPDHPVAKQGLEAAMAGRKTMAVLSEKKPTLPKTLAPKAKPVAKPEPKKAVKAAPSKKSQVDQLLKSAAFALKKRRYQEAIDIAEKARAIEIPGQTQYLNQAKQIIDQGRQKQKEEFEPFLALSKKKLEGGDAAGSAMLCEEMLRTDPSYQPAKDCLERAAKAGGVR